MWVSNPCTSAVQRRTSGREIECGSLRCGGEIGCVYCRSKPTYRGTSLMRNRAPLGPCSRILPQALLKPYTGGLFLMSEAPL